MNNTALYQRTILILVLIVVLAIPSHAQDTRAAGQLYVSTTGNDSNDCLSPSSPCATINAGLSKAGDGDTILVQEGVYTGEGCAVIYIEKGITLSGGWDSTFTHQTGTSTIDAQKMRQGINIPSINSITIEHFTIQNGIDSVPGCYQECGAGIENGGYLTLNHVTVSANESAGAGGGICSRGSLSVNNSLIQGNQAVTGGGIYGYGFGVEIVNSVLSDNHADKAGGGFQADGMSQRIINSTIHNNTASECGGGIYGGNYLVITNSTISGNQATNQPDGRGGGICVPSFGSSSQMFLNNSTITKNSAANGGGIYSAHDNFRIYLQNTILAGNTATNGPDCAIDLISRGSNLIGNTAGCNPSNATGDLLNVNPGLHPLTGSPGYHPLKADSPAIDAGDPTGCTDQLGSPLDTDQRGIPRSGRCDIGAYEFDFDAHYKIKTFLPLSLATNSSTHLFADDFSDPNSGWPVWNTENSQAGYSNGEYLILVRADNGWAAAHPGLRASDYLVSVVVRNANPSGELSSGGLAFGMDKDFETFYTLEIYPDGTFGLYRYNQTEIIPLAEAFSPAIYPGATANEIAIARSGSSIKAYANGQLLVSLTDDNFTGNRYIGLMAYAYSYASIYFDNFSVDQLNSAGNGSIFNDRDGQNEQPGLLYLDADSEENSSASRRRERTPLEADK